MHRYIRADVSQLSDESEETRMDLARNPNTNPRILRRLADDESVLVRTYVAINPNTPEEIVEALKDGRIAPEIAIEVNDVYGDWEWDPRDYLDNVTSDWEDHVVVFSDTLDSAEPAWWTDTETALCDLVSCYAESESYEEFVAKVKEEYEDTYDEDYIDFREVYEVFESYDGEINDDAISDAIELFNDVQITQERIYGPQRWGNREPESAYVIYEDDEIDIDEFRDWFFGAVYETREYGLDLDNIPTHRDVDFYEMYYEYGDDLGNYDLITEHEMEKMRATGHLEDAICRRLGYVPAYCTVFGSI